MHTTAVAPPPAVERNSEGHGGGGSGYYVQLSAQKSEEEAKSSFHGIQARHSGLLGGQQLFVRRKDLGSKGIFYGAQVGPFSREAANKLCEDLKAAGQGCMVQRN
jgi:cell division septation protein DedD